MVFSPLSIIPSRKISGSTDGVNVTGKGPSLAVKVEASGGCLGPGAPVILQVAPRGPWAHSSAGELPQSRLSPGLGLRGPPAF